MTLTALVTGANRGIGLAISEGLAAQGIRVLMGSRDLSKGEEAAEQTTGDVEPVKLDLSTKETTADDIAAVIAAEPRIDVLINNAGMISDGNFLEVEPEEFYNSIQTNFVAPFDLTRACLPAMIENNYGRIVNLSSGWGSFDEGLAGPAAYAVSKAALNALTVSASQSVSGDVKINSMCPGWVRTDMGGPQANKSPHEGADTALWLATIPADGPNGGFFRDRKQIEW